MRVSLLVTSAWLILAAVVSAKSPGKKAVRALPVVAPTITSASNGAGADPSPQSSNTQPETTSQAPPPPTTTSQPPTTSPTSTSTTVESTTTATSSSVPPTTSSSSSSSAPPTSRPPQSTSAPLTSFKSSASASMPSSMNVFTSTSSVLSPSASASSAPASSPSSGSNTPLIIGSVCGFIAILSIGFAYAFFSKVRKNRRKERVFGGEAVEEDDGPTGMPARPRANDEWEPDYKRSPSPMPTRLSPPAATRQLHDQDYYSQYTGYDHSGGYEQHPGYEQHTGYDHAGAYEAYGGAQYPQQGYGYPQQAEIPMTPYQQPSGYNNGYPQQPYH